MVTGPVSTLSSPVPVTNHVMGCTHKQCSCKPAYDASQRSARLRQERMPGISSSWDGLVVCWQA